MDSNSNSRIEDLEAASTRLRDELLQMTIWLDDLEEKLRQADGDDRVSPYASATMQEEPQANSGDQSLSPQHGVR